MARWGSETERFLDLVEKTETCWLWKGHHDAQGRPTHGRVPGSGTRPERAYRRAYRLFVGEIPEGCAAHHTCQNPRCVNPAHLEILTPRAHGILHKRREICVRGHDPDWRITPSGHRYCGTCDIERRRRRLTPCVVCGKLRGPAGGGRYTDTGLCRPCYSASLRVQPRGGWAARLAQTPE